jgi:hypothetical protein
MDNSSFNSLPAEMRITIYEYALTFDRVSCKPHGSSRFWPERSLKIQLALTRVCKQIRAECQHLPFTLNTLVVGEAPSRERQDSLSIPDLHSIADEVARTVGGIPSGLISDTTVLGLDLKPWARYMLRYGGPGKRNESDFVTRWAAVKLFLGRLLRTTGTHNFLLDITPNEKFGVHPWCDAGEDLRIETDRESRYELQPEIATADKDKRHFVVAATFNTSRILATADQHRDHDRSLCNVTKHGDALLARMAKLERAAGVVIDQRSYGWNSTD